MTAITIKDYADPVQPYCIPSLFRYTDHFTSQIMDRIAQLGPNKPAEFISYYAVGIPFAFVQIVAIPLTITLDVMAGIAESFINAARGCSKDVLKQRAWVKFAAEPAQQLSVLVVFVALGFFSYMTGKAAITTPFYQFDSILMDAAYKAVIVAAMTWLPCHLLSKKACASLGFGLDSKTSNIFNNDKYMNGSYEHYNQSQENFDQDWEKYCQWRGQYKSRSWQDKARTADAEGAHRGRDEAAIPDHIINKWGEFLGNDAAQLKPLGDDDRFNQFMKTVLDNLNTEDPDPIINFSTKRESGKAKFRELMLLCHPDKNKERKTQADILTKIIKEASFRYNIKHS